jgi:hypothetical protein
MYTQRRLPSDEPNGEPPSTKRRKAEDTPEPPVQPTRLADFEGTRDESCERIDDSGSRHTFGLTQNIDLEKRARQLRAQITSRKSRQARPNRQNSLASSAVGSI